MKNILIIDDSEANLFLIQSIFDDDPDILVRAETDSTKALPSLREALPDLLILDLMMPHIDGFQLLKEIKSHPHFASVPIMVISARHDMEAIERVMQYGVETYIKKPVDLAEIETTIRGLLRPEKV